MSLRPRLAQLLETLWFLPGLLVAAFAVSGVALAEVESRHDITGLPIVFPGDAEAARGILSSIAGSIITVAGLTLSLTMVVLQLVATQYTPRALRQVLRDRLTQVASGVFVGVFVFSLAVLRSVRDDNVPGLGVTLSILFAVAALGMLLAFINNVAQSIQVGTITADTSRQALRLVRERFPSSRQEEVVDVTALPAVTRTVCAGTAGFVQRIDEGRICRLAPEGQWTIELLVQPGDFVAPSTPVAALRGDPPDQLAEKLPRALQIADHRTLAQDETFAIRLLADIALRALSPGINDPTTAITAIQHLGVILEEIARRHDPPRSKRLREDELTLVRPDRPFDAILSPVAEIGRACTDPRPLHAILETLEQLTRAAAGGGQPRHALAAVATATEVRNGARRRLDGADLDGPEATGSGPRVAAGTVDGEDGAGAPCDT